MIYFIKSGEFVKIGYSTDVAKRMSGLQTSTPNKLCLLSSFYGTFADEKRIHKKFEDERVRGEWFNLTDEIVEFADKCNGFNKDGIWPEFEYGDIIIVQSGKYAGRHGSILASTLSSDVATVGLRVKNTDWLRAFTISIYDLVLVPEVLATIDADGM